MSNDAAIHMGSIGINDRKPTFLAGGSWNAQ
jgi:hypothetical protein